ncbi:uncharacterized protein LAESUDRAFT_729859 [Laetiporus sulphureus 93-53]|uniref:Uncharacterized protein n=1 Tax=Laetiporus sulphureus 93-53 TaxID=1314785 RepID=A0A165CIC3_9APHY|nr:uncharacterized protein LAESUDRAFT_729859 [Laetiporus sulphureus 93-53]KZT02866.1 hypothetical protein LAESUDRAFT_729859 [Laetiporus sulphureus 93-53]
MAPTTGSLEPTASNDAQSSVTGVAGNDYPEQRHAGAVGLGPEYGRGVTTEDKIVGFKEEVKGKILHKPDVAERGRMMRTGELKKKHEEEENRNNPFETVDEDQKKAGATDDMVMQSNDNQHASMPPGVADSSHPTDSDKYAEASTIAPEGSQDAERQRGGDHAYRTIG